MGIFAVDLGFRAKEIPVWGQTILGSGFRLGPGGKGSNQAVAAARLGGKVHFISKIGRDVFGDMAVRLHTEEGVDTRFLLKSTEHPTGAASIIIDETRGDNAIIVFPGAASTLTCEEIDEAEAQISASAAFMTQLELPVPIVEHGLKLARRLGIPTILNPAPARDLPPSLYELCEYLTPNESEAEALTGISVSTLAQAECAADALLDQGVQNIVLTLGARGALIKNASGSAHIQAFNAGAVVETTGAGDAFNAGLAIALSEGMEIADAVKFSCAVAAICVTRPGTAPSMPTRSEVDALIVSA
jgi:ribokinase